MEEKDHQDKAAAAGERSHVYGFLAAVYRKELTPEFLREMRAPSFLGVLSEFGVNWQHGFLDKPEGALLEELAVDYAHLFLGPGKHVSPHESVHRPSKPGDPGRLWSDATVEVKRFIETVGFHYQETYTGLPDHISAELEFMEKVSLSQGEAWLADDPERATYCRNIEKRFISEHLARWVPAFCDQIAALADLPFYRDLAQLTKRFIELETQAASEEGEREVLGDQMSGTGTTAFREGGR